MRKMSHSSDSNGDLGPPKQRSSKLQKRANKRSQFNALIDELRQELLGGENDSYAGKVPQADVLSMAATYLEYCKNDDRPQSHNQELSFFGSMVPFSAVGDAVILIGSDMRIIQAAILYPDPNSVTGDKYRLCTELEGVAFIDCLAREERQEVVMQIAKVLSSRGLRNLGGQQSTFACSMQNLPKAGDSSKFNFSVRALHLRTDTYLLLVGRYLPGTGALLPLTPPSTRSSTLQCNWTIYRPDAVILYTFGCAPNDTMLGYPVSHLVSQQIYNVIHPEDTPSVANVHRGMHERRTGGFFVGRLRHASGRYVQMLKSSIPCINKTTGEIDYYLAYSLHAEPVFDSDPPASSHLSRVVGGSGLKVDGVDELVALCQKLSLELEPESLRMAQSFEEAEEALILAQHTQLLKALESSTQKPEFAGAVPERTRQARTAIPKPATHTHGPPNTPGPGIQSTDESVIRRLIEPFAPLLSRDLEQPIVNPVKSELSQSHGHTHSIEQMIGSVQPPFALNGSSHERWNETPPFVRTNPPGYPNAAQSNSLMGSAFGQRTSPVSAAATSANFKTPYLPDMEGAQSFPQTPSSIAPAVRSPQDQTSYSQTSFPYINKDVFMPPQEGGEPIRTHNGPWPRSRDEVSTNQDVGSLHSTLLETLETLLGIQGTSQGDRRPNF